MPKPYEERLEAMLKPTARAADIAAIITETEGMVAAASAEAIRQRALSVDPAQDETAAAAARRKAQDLDFGVERLTAKLTVLRDRYTARIESDQAVALRQERAALEAETTALAAEISARVPAIFAELIDLFGRIEANNASVARAGPSVATAEARARGYTGAVWPNLGGYVQHLTEMQIPRFDGAGLAWPRQVDTLAAFGFVRIPTREETEAKEQRQAEFERTRWKRVAIRGSSTGMTGGIQNRDGICGARHNACFVVEMDQAQITKAKARGVTVEPWDREKHAGAEVHPALMGRDHQAAQAELAAERRAEGKAHWG